MAFYQPELIVKNAQVGAETHGLRYGAQMVQGNRECRPRRPLSLDGEALVFGEFGEEMPQKKSAGSVLDPAAAIGASVGTITAGGQGATPA